jgi:hypothetical protein
MTVTASPITEAVVGSRTHAVKARQTASPTGCHRAPAVRPPNG